MGELGIAFLIMLLLLLCTPFLAAKVGLEATVGWLAENWGLAIAVYYIIIIFIFSVGALLIQDEYENSIFNRLLNVPSRCIAFSGFLIFIKFYLIPVVVNANYDIGFGAIIDFALWCIFLFFMYLGYFAFLPSENRELNIFGDYCWSFVFAILVILLTILARNIDRVA